MFTQFFGSYLLNRQIVSADNLKKAIELKSSTRVKLGVLAINAGYMTAKQVDDVHRMQATVDKRIGDIAVEMGYLTAEQVDELLSTQKTGCLVLGQTLVDMGCLTNEEFENALNGYKTENQLEDEDFVTENANKSGAVIGSFYKIDEKKTKNPELIAQYIDILFKNLIRFIGDDFTPLSDGVVVDGNTAVTQAIGGGFEAVTSVIADDKALVEFASRYAEEKLTENDEYTKDVVSEFLNLSNGLFTVNVSNNIGKELSLAPQETKTAAAVKAIKAKYALMIPVAFSFGTVIFTIAEI
ncbi:MAG: chemotaxis protein CheX [Eubacterium sp.]|nr:chemotaxis protein CheX [Eubacterium sp.]